MPPRKERRREDYLPSPPIGYRVVWKEQGRSRSLKPADVVGQIEYSPGVLILSINHGQQLKVLEGVPWENHPSAQNLEIDGIKLRGTWAYVPDAKIPDSHYDVHIQTEEQTAINMKKQQEYIAEQQRLMEEEANQPVDPVHVAVARAQAEAILNG